MISTDSGESQLRKLMQAIVIGKATTATKMLATSPALARARVSQGATRQTAKASYLGEIAHYLYAGDTALHIAAAAYQTGIVMHLIARGANVSAKNRRGAEPLHYAADGVPGSRAWNPRAQEATILCLIGAGADPNAIDKNGATPLHRAVRTRCAAAVEALLSGGAHVLATNNGGSTPLSLATRNTGRRISGGEGTANTDIASPKRTAALVTNGSDQSPSRCRLARPQSIRVAAQADGGSARTRRAIFWQTQ